MYMGIIVSVSIDLQQHLNHNVAVATMYVRKVVGHFEMRSALLCRRNRKRKYQKQEVLLAAMAGVSRRHLVGGLP